MSVLEIYLQWVNSVLAEAGGHIGGSQAVQDGQVLCQLIDILAPSAGLVSKVKSSGKCTALDYVNAALDHMQKHGIRIKFSAEDIVNNEIKSILDILWILILNYSIHYIGQNAFQRSVGTGKKNLLEWCMEQLGTTFDLGKSLSENLCQGDWFIRLLEKAIGGHLPRYEDKAEYIETLLKEIENSYGIKKEIVKASDVVDATVDEHTLMIYLSLFRRRCPISNMHFRKQSYGENAAAARDRFADKRSHQVYDPSRSRSEDREVTNSSRRRSNSGNDNHSSPARSTHQSSSYQSRSIDDDTLYETVIENVAYTKYHREQSKQRGEKDAEMLSSGDTLRSTSARRNLHRQDKVNSSSVGSGSSGGDYQSDRLSRTDNNGTNTWDEPCSDQQQRESVTIKRPKDYILQWENAMDRLSFAAAHENHGLINTLPVGRSQSCDLGRLNSFFSEMPENNLSTKRSKSTGFLSINNHSLHSHNVDSALNKLPKYMQEKAKSASKFFLQADLPEVSELLNAIQTSKVRSYGSGSQSLSSYLDDGEQTVLKTVEKSTYSVRDLPKSQEFAAPLSNRFHSLSPRRRRAVSPFPPEKDGERGSNTMLSIYPRDRSLSPIRKDFETKPKLDLINSGASSSILGYTDYKFDTDMKFEFTSPVRDSSPSPDRRGGTSRIPRREAWELQRRVQESCDVNTESQMMDILSQEIQELKEKVDLMEEDKLERRRSLSSTRLLPDVSSGVGDFLSLPTLQYSRERAISCPLLTVSSQSAALRPSSILHQDYKSEVNLYQPLKPRSPQNLLSTYSSSNPPLLSRVVSPARVAGPRLDTSFPLESPPTTNWRQLIAKRQLTEAEVTELKKALACAVADNDMLSSKLESARDEVYDKLRHTNSVLDDCRHHLAKAQVENMEFRSLLEKERSKNVALENKVKDMEQYFSELKANNEELEDELGQTTNMLNKSMAETIPEVQALKLENAQLASQLAEAENENDFLREDVQNLKQRHSKAMSTIDELREILSKVRKERQELFMELAAFDRREQSAKIAKIINSYKEKGAKDEEESERNVNKLMLPSVIKNSTRGNYFCSRSATPPSSQCKYYSDDDLDDSHVSREIYPHRRSYTPRSRNHSPQQAEPRSRSVSPHSVKYFTADQMPNVESSLQHSDQNSITSHDYRLYKNHSSLKRNLSPSYVNHTSSNLSQGKTYHSMKDLSGRKSRSPSPRPGILKGKAVFRAESTVPLRSPSASYVRCSKRNLTPDRTSSLRDISLEKDNLDDLPTWPMSAVSKERPLHKKSEPGEIAKSIQRDFDQEDQLLQALSQSSVLRNKSWFELQRILFSFIKNSSDADDSDTGINSSMSSYEYSLSIGKNTPILTEDQRRYADQLVQKYTANMSM